MKAECIPTVRLELEHMKHCIISALGVHGSQLGEAIDEQVQKAIANYDWEGQVKSIVHEAIQEHIKCHFKYGDGAKAIRASLNQVFEDASSSMQTKKTKED